MKTVNSILALAVTTIAPLTSAHYAFSQLIVNDAAVGTDCEYRREHTRNYMPTQGAEILEDGFRCNQGASSGSSTSVYTINAGDRVALKQAYGWFKMCEGLLCRSGDAAALQNDAWCMHGEDRIAFAVPDGLPAHEGNAEFYCACAQVELGGAAAGAVPGPTVKIPGVYRPGDAAVNFSVWAGETAYPDIPGPEAVEGGEIRGSTTG